MTTKTPDYSPFPRPWTSETMTQLADYAEAGPVLSAMERDLVEVVRLAARPPEPEPPHWETVAQAREVVLKAIDQFGNAWADSTKASAWMKAAEGLDALIAAVRADPPFVIRREEPMGGDR